MLNDLVKPHLANAFFFSNPGGRWEYVAFLVVACVAQAFIGAGSFAVESARAVGGRDALSA